jgi:hypothetical protein
LVYPQAADGRTGRLSPPSAPKRRPTINTSHTNTARHTSTNTHYIRTLLGTVEQIPALPPSKLCEEIAFIEPRVMELTYTCWDHHRLASELGYYSPPFQWQDERRSLIRAELDALMFRAYGVSHDDLSYIMDTFSILRRRDEATFGEYKTKRLISSRFAAMTRAVTEGRKYETALDPPPADPSLAHPESTRPSWAPRVKAD